MANPTAGYYMIIPVSAPTKALDINGNNQSNGTNVQIWSQNITDAQFWRVSYRSDGSAQITSRLTGKSIDVEADNLVSGANVLMWTDHDKRNQKWEFVEKSTLVVSGVTCKTYEIHLTAATTLCLDVNGASAADGTNVQVWTRNDGDNQRWALYPVPVFRSGGVYEIKSIMNTKMNVDIAGGSTTNGANCHIWPDNDGNPQKFVFVDEGDGWSIRNVASGKYLDVYGGTFANGINVQSWVDNEGRNQRWAITNYSTMTIDGVTCQVVSIGAGNANNYMLDVYKALIDTGTNVIIYEANSGRNQRFALYPTWAVDPHMPTPHTLGFGNSVYDAAYTDLVIVGSSGSATKRFYPMWTCADAWATSGPNSYQWRYRYRYMASSNSSWEGWGGWTAWNTALVTRDGARSSVTEGLPVDFALSSRKCCQIQFEVRACGVDSLSLLYGATASCTGTFYYVQNVSMSSAVWSPEGLRVACSTDYPYGTTTLYVKSVKWGNKEHLTGGEFTTKQMDDSTSFLIPQSRLNAVPADEQTVTLVFDYGSDMYSRWGGVTQTRNVTVSLDSTAAETVTFAEAEGKTLLASVNNIGTTRMWIVANGEIIECPVVSKSNGVWSFRIAYPFNTDYDVITAGTSSNDDSFYVDRKTRHESGACHAWTLSDGTAVALELREGSPLTTDFSLDAVYEGHVLNARGWEAYSFAETRKGKFSVEGATVDSVSGSTYVDVENLVGKHAVYRSPSGDMCDVAVLSCSRVTHKQWTGVSVTMARETL